MLLNHESIRLENPGVIASALTLFVDHQGVGFSDCLILASARSIGNTPLATFDRKLGALEGAHRL